MFSTENAKRLVVSFSVEALVAEDAVETDVGTDRVRSTGQAYKSSEAKNFLYRINN